MKTFEDFLRRAFEEGQRDLAINVNAHGATIAVQLADKGPRIFSVESDKVVMLTEPVKE